MAVQDMDPADAKLIAQSKAAAAAKAAANRKILDSMAVTEDPVATRRVLDNIGVTAAQAASPMTSSFTSDANKTRAEAAAANAPKPEYKTAQIYNQYGELVTVYAEGPQAGYDVATGGLVIQGSAPVTTPTNVTPPVPPKTTTTTNSDPATLALIQSLQSQIANLTAAQNSAASSAAAQAKATAETNRQSAIAILTDRFTKYGLASLVGKIKELAVDGATEATITLGLQETEEYKQRFSANIARQKAGLQVLTPAEYLKVEDGYRQVLREYGLNQFSTDEYVNKFIENDVSAAELSNRVSIAVQRVQNADPAITKQLTDYYGIGQADLLGYVLDPKQQITKIQRQVAAAEVGVAAARQGLTAGVNVAEQLAAQGITQAEAQKGYSTIADILPTAEKLSEIYGGTMDTYGQSEAEQEVFNSLASAQRKREALSKREVASFSGSSGMAKGLTSKAAGQI